jgi:hypothetical protein
MGTSMDLGLAAGQTSPIRARRDVVRCATVGAVLARAHDELMPNVLESATYGRELLITAAAAAERMPQLADEIRAHSRHLARRISAGGRLHPHELDVRTLVGLIEQSGVQVPPARIRQA